MSTTPTLTGVARPSSGPQSAGSRRGRRRRFGYFGGGVAVLVVAGVVLVVTDPFSGPAKSGSGVADNNYPISYQTVKRGTISSQVEESGTLGYAGATSILLPSGTGTSTLQQAQQQLASAERARSSAEASLSTTLQSNAESLAQAEQQVAAAEVTLASDDLALGTARQSNSEAMVQAEQQVASARASLASDNAGLGTTGQSNSEAIAQAEAQVAAARKTLASDEAALATTEKSNDQALAQAEAQAASAIKTLAGDEAALSTNRQANSQALTQAQAQVKSARSTVATDEASLGSTLRANSVALAQAEAQVATARQSLEGDEKALSTANQSNSEAMDQAEQQLSTAKATLAADRTQLETDQATLSAEQQKEAVDCRSAGGAGATTPTSGASSGGSSACAADEAQVSTDQSTVSSDQTKVTSDEAGVVSAQQAVAKQKTTNAAAVRQANDQIQAAKISVDQDKATLAKDEASAAVSAGGNLYTELPTSGQVIRRGQQLFGIGGNPVVLLYGDVTPARAFLPGMPPGRDVAALNANLDALGYARELKGGRFTPATEKAVKAFQKAHGMADTGQLPLGSVIFEPGAVRVTSVVPKLGSNVGAGQPVLDVTLLTRQVNISLDAAQQSEVKVGDKVSIVLPDNSTTPGVVSSVGKVASTSSNGTTITVLVTPTNPAATGTLDSAPVNVWITEASAPNAYIVPVDALVALSSGGYALEVAGANGVHTLEAVSLGLFDDADGLVQVNGPQVRAGQKIVVPAP